MKQLLSFLSIFTIALITVTLLLLFKKNKKELKDKILFTIYLFLLFLSFYSYAVINDIKWLIYITLLPVLILETFVAPSFLIYIKSLFENPNGLIRRNIFHYCLIPIQLALSLFAIQYKNTSLLTILSLAYTIYSMVYLITSLRQINFYQSRTKEIFSTIEKYEFKWIKNLIIGLAIIQTTSIFLSFQEIAHLVTDTQAYYITSIMFSLFIIYISYNGLTQTSVLLPNFLIEEGIEASIYPTEEPEIIKTSQKSTVTSATVKDDTKKNDNNSSLKPNLAVLTDVEIEIIKSNLNSVIKEQTPHLDPDLTLSKLAKMVNTSSKKLSYFLNHYEEQKFYDFVNARRVEAVKKKLADPEYNQYTLIAIANECGFNSKTTFNRIFKKITGHSPSTYRSNLNK